MSYKWSKGGRCGEARALGGTKLTFIELSTKFELDNIKNSMFLKACI
jgi:hypothetical protein